MRLMLHANRLALPGRQGSSKRRLEYERSGTGIDPTARLGRTRHVGLPPGSVVV